MKTIKYCTGLIFFLLVSTISWGQQNQDDLITWEYKLSKDDLHVGDKVELELHVKIDPAWYIYGAQFKCDPQKTEIDFSEGTNKGYKALGQLTSPGDKEKFDDIFECNYRYFKKEGVFKMPIEITAENVQIEGLIIYQLCTVKDGMCIPFDRPLLLKKKVKAKPQSSETDTKAGAETGLKSTKDNTSKVENPSPDTRENGNITGQVNVEQVDSSCCQRVYEQQQEILARLNGEYSNKPGLTQAIAGSGEKCSIERRAGYDHITIEPFDHTEKKDDWRALLVFMGVAFIGGLAALLTPCVFPMIPMTVTFFTKSSKSRAKGITNALIYGFSIIAIFVLLGTVVAYLFGPNFAHTLSTHWLPNGIFFLVFIIFALSFLGLFEITLPSRFVNNMDKQSDKGGLIGVFFMAFTLVLVSFSCTGPIVGSILIESAGGEFLKPIVGMLGFSLAFALPFTLFALFPSWLNSLPQSGGWLNAVKVVLGLFEFAFAFKFLSQIDLIEGWGVLDRNVFLAIWVASFLMIGIYLIGKIRFPHDSPLEKIGVFRAIVAVLTFSFVIYMAPGLWGAPLKLLSGILPPRTTQDFDLERMIREQGIEGNNICEEPLYEDLFHLPHSLNGYFDLQQAICCAIEQNKPIFVDFTGHGCANCRRMEESVWSDPKVYKKLREDFVIVALYTDDKNKLPQEERYIDKDGEKISRIGKAALDFEKRFFNRVAQPYYVLLGVNEVQTKNGKIVLNELAQPQPYNPDVNNFVEFLETGVGNYKDMQQ